MSHEYCLPITIKLDSSNRMAILLAVLYLLPLLPVYIQLDVLWACAITLICLAILKYELNRQANLKPFSSIRVDEKETWYLVDQQGKSETIIFKSFIWFGTVLFLLFIRHRKQHRVMIFKNQQQPEHFHKLKVYLQNA